MKRKILVFTSTFPRWHNDTNPPFVYELCKRLTDQFEVHVLTPHYPGAEHEENFGKIKVKRYRYFLPKFEKLAGSIGILPTLKRNKLYFLVVPFFIIAGFLSLLTYTLKIKPDLIHAHWIIPQGFLVYLVSFLYRKPYIVTAHGADVFGLRLPIFAKLRSLVLQNATTITAVSNALKLHLLEQIKDGNKIVVLPMGVDSGCFNVHVASGKSEQGLDKNSPKILNVGRLTEKKGVSYLIHAIPEVKKVYPDIHLTIVGGGELAVELKEEALSIGLEMNVTFQGAVPNYELPEYYASHSIFVGPSIESKGGDTEGFGLTFVEAAMAGCLLIGTDVGGVRDIIQEGETGLLVKQKDSADIALKILYALSNKEKMNVIANNGKLRCTKNYDWKVISQKYTRLIQNAIGKDVPSKSNF
jgi:glycosyltransferase involved in cell wall biosynthesis